MITKCLIENIVNDVMCELTAYHANPNNFSRFSTSVKHKGNGYNPLYGYGIYVTVSKENALSYIQKDGYLYIVEIPDDKDNVYLDVNKKCPKNVLQAIVTRLYSYFKNNTTIDDIEQYIKNNFGTDITYIQLLGMLNKYMNEKDVINNILYPLGYVGIKYNTTNTNNISDVINYVVFKSKDVIIINKTKI